MAIQIDEKHLSPEARKALNNAKSKSQFMRDAIEFYVNKNMENLKVSCDAEMKDDIKEIKAMLKGLSVAGISLEEVSSSKEIENYTDESKAETKIDTESNKVVNILQVSLTSEVNTDDVKNTNDEVKLNDVSNEEVNNDSDLEDVEVPNCYE